MFRIGLIVAGALAGVAVPATAQTTVTRTTVVRHGGHPGTEVVRHRRKVCTVRRVGHRKIRRCFWR